VPGGEFPARTAGASPRGHPSAIRRVYQLILVGLKSRQLLKIQASERTNSSKYSEASDKMLSKRCRSDFIFLSSRQLVIMCHLKRNFRVRAQHIGKIDQARIVQRHRPSRLSVPALTSEVCLDLVDRTECLEMLNLSVAKILGLKISIGLKILAEKIRK
jgi:hypothetical protein